MIRADFGACDQVTSDEKTREREPTNRHSLVLKSCIAIFFSKQMTPVVVSQIITSPVRLFGALDLEYVYLSSKL
jgi:hypothetical protein